MNEDIYIEFILEHYKHPKNFGKIANPDIHSHDNNPLCGDEVELFLKIKDGAVDDVKFYGKGCAISQASASILTELIKGKKIQELENLKENDLLNELGIKLSPVRLKCALLSFTVLKEGLRSHR